MRYIEANTNFVSKRLVVAVSLVVLCLSIVNIVLSAEVSHFGSQIDLLAQQESALLHEQEQLRRSMIEVDALTQLAQVAEERGFSDPVKPVDLAAMSRIAYVQAE